MLVKWPSQSLGLSSGENLRQCLKITVKKNPTNLKNLSKSAWKNRFRKEQKLNILYAIALKMLLQKRGGPTNPKGLNT